MPRQVLKLHRQLHREEHRDTLRSMNNLAGTRRDLGDLAAARTLEEQVLAACSRVLGEEHPDTSISAWSLFDSLRTQDDPAARAILEVNLLWLLQRDPATLTAEQRKIREMLQKTLGP